ncbi:phosphatidylglycerol lysyltransferase domain-containing protein [Loktanella sp. DJP18]|uniref:phosphatidylglycerol lysyltransferase domain-containing protein n=1 Tax=Loktanella sp. DJP18 TaxID=3409788 RepID=UPI003BB80C9A
MRQHVTIHPAWRAARVTLPTALGIGLLVWGAGQLPAHALATALDGLPAIAPWRWIAALGLTGLSFVVMGRMEAVWHVALRLNTQPHAARRTGRIAVAVGQCVGAASVVAGLLRWRLLRDTTPPADVARLSLAASLSFMLCWSVSALVAIWWVALTGIPSLSLTLLPFLLTAAGLASWRYGPMLWRNRAVATGVLGWCQLDLLCAAAVFLLLAPSDLPALDVVAVFTLAVGARLATHLPMGLGAFDLVVLALLPVPVAQMLPALLAYRLVYGILPGVMGLLALRQPHALPGRDSLRCLLRNRAPAIWALSGQGASVWQDDRGAALVGQALFARAIIGETLRDTPAALARTSRYKCSARAAARLRRVDWSVMVIATESWIDPQVWTCDGPARSTLRRKLRQARSAGVVIRIIDPGAMATDLNRIAATWARAHGGERGFSMGRYHPACPAGPTGPWHLRRRHPARLRHLSGRPVRLDAGPDPLRRHPARRCDPRGHGRGVRGCKAGGRDRGEHGCDGRPTRTLRLAGPTQYRTATVQGRLRAPHPDALSCRSQSNPVPVVCQCRSARHPAPARAADILARTIVFCRVPCDGRHDRPYRTPCTARGHR